MSARPCDIRLDKCGGQDAPITNWSSEAPDPVLFFGVGWPPYDPFAPVPLGDGPHVKVDCSNITWSDVSQEMADLLAQINAAFCEPPAPVVPPLPPLPPLPIFPDPGGDGGSPAPVRTFCNDPQSFTVVCSDGSTHTVNVPAGIYCQDLPEDLGPQWVAFINDWIVSYYQTLAQEQCPTPTIVPSADDLVICANDRQQASVECPDGSIFSLAIEAGTVQSPAIPRELCDAWKAYVNATLLASLLQQIYDQRVCADPPNPTLRVPPGVPPPSPPPRNPRFSDFPNWCCFGSALTPEAGIYNITNAGTGTWNFSVTGFLPPGTQFLVTGPHTAVVAGTPTAPGDYPFTVVATNGSKTISIPDRIFVFGLSSASLPDAFVGNPYSAQMPGTGASGSITYTALSGLPPGLSLSPSGQLSGVPTVGGDYTITVELEDESNDGTCQQSISLHAGVLTCFDPATFVCTVSQGTGPGNTIHTPAVGVASASFDVGVNGAVFADPAQASISMETTYVGAACTLRFIGNLTVNYTPGEVVHLDLAVQYKLGGIWFPFTFLVQLPAVTGPFNVTWPVPDTGGQPMTIHLIAGAVQNTPFPGVYWLEVSATMTCEP